MLIKRIEHVLLLVLDAFPGPNGGGGRDRFDNRHATSASSYCRGRPSAATPFHMALLVLVGGDALVATILCSGASAGVHWSPASRP